MNQAQFLSNEKNKHRLINMIFTLLNTAGNRTKIDPEDADGLIVVTSIENARNDSETTVERVRYVNFILFYKILML